MMEKLTFILICHFGLEKILKNEIRRLGLEVTEVTDGELKALGEFKDIPRLNFNLRTAERVMIELGHFKATTFEELFENVKKLPIEDFVPVDGNFPITKANQDKNSKLHSSTSIQSIVKKAMVERLKDAYKTNLLSEDNGKFPFRVKMYKDIASIRLDTTGDSLHKRGYRIKAGLAPMEETLAASLIKLSGFGSGKLDRDTYFVDPFCGSGTIPIEAALILANVPVSIDRAFVSETWRHLIDKKMWEEAKSDALSKVDKERLKGNEIKIYGFDIDSNMIKIARDNAARAGVDKMIHFECLPVKDFADSQYLRDKHDGIIVTNPPYGERLEDKEKIVPIYKDLRDAYKKLPDFDLHFITSYEDAEKLVGKATKNRKLYNGMLKTYLYSYIKKEG